MKILYLIYITILPFEKLAGVIQLWQSPTSSFSYPLPVGGYAAHGVRLSHHEPSCNVVGQRWRPARPRNASFTAEGRQAESKLWKGEAALQQHTINTVSRPRQHGLNIQKPRLLWASWRMRCTYSKWPQHPEPGAGSPTDTNQCAQHMMLFSWYLTQKNTMWRALSKALDF